MRIQTAGLSDGIHEFHFETAPGELALGNGFEGPVLVDADVDKGPRHLLLRAKIRVGAEFECDRCITRFTRELTPSYQMYYVWNEPDASRFDPSEVQVIPAGMSVISLDEDVRQTIQVSLPLKVLCREDCRGLCPRCGKNLNEGPCLCRENEPERA